MGLGKTSKAKYVSIFKGNCEVSVPAPTTGSITRTTESGKVKHVQHFDFLKGRVVDAYKSENEWEGKTISSLNIAVQDGGEDYVFSLSWNSRPVSAFFNAMQNIDYSKPVTFSPYIKDERTNLAIYQDDASGKSALVPWSYTKDSPGDKPAWEQIKVKGELVWDNTKEIEFYMNILETVVKPKIQAAKPTEQQIAEEVGAELFAPNPGDGLASPPEDKSFAVAESGGDGKMPKGSLDDDLPW